MTLDITGIQTDFNNILNETGESAVLYTTVSGALNEWGQKSTDYSAVGSVTIMIQQIDKELMRREYGSVPDYSAIGYTSSGTSYNINDKVTTLKTSYEVSNVETFTVSGVEIYQQIGLSNLEDK